MEVLSCSGVHYVGESDRPQEDAGTCLVHGDEPSCVKITPQVETPELKVDSMVIDMEETQQERQDGVQWTVGAMPTSESNAIENAYHESEDSPKLSSDSHDSVDENTEIQAHVSDTGLPLERSQPDANTNEGGNLNKNQEGEAFLREPPLLERDEPLAVWVKWRGKWQAGIKCARADWPLSTLRAKPTHDRKKYLVIFFPRTRNFSWADVLLVCTIHEFPQPIAYKNHKVGIKMVKDLTLAHRFIMQKLAVGLLNIFDQLHREALVETARNVMVWKEFAMEASQCKDYPDIGRMLMKFQDMILPRYKNSTWLENSHQSWAQQCQNANSAEAAEILKEELVESILWNDINSLPHDPAHLQLSLEWKTCKHEVMKWFSVSNPVSPGGDPQKLTSDSPSSVGLQQSQKRAKLEVRRADTHTSQVDSQGHETITLADSGFFSGHDTVYNETLDSEHTKAEISLGEAPPTGSPGSVADKWGDIIVEPENSEISTSKTEISTSKNAELTPTDGVLTTTRSFNHGNKYRQCIAFIQAKGRQCVRWANDGDVYCCVHLASRFSSSSLKTEATPPAEAGMCEGTTVLGTKCKHRSLLGSSFCKKHRPKSGTNLSFSSPESNLKRKHVDFSQTTNCRDIVVADGLEPPLDVDPISVRGGDSFKGNNLIQMHGYIQREYADTEQPCIGLWPQDGVCSESSKKHSLYCDKHLPSWLKRARDGKSRIISKEVFVELLKSCHSREQKLFLHQACELFYRLLKSVMSRRNPVPKEVQFQWAISEASKDVRVREFLVKLVQSEKERLKRLWGFSFNENTQELTCSETVPDSILNENNQDDENEIRCKFCSAPFPNDQALGRHCMDNHTKEAQWLFRGYVCAICLDSFTNKKVLESHVQGRHHAEFFEHCMLFQCIPCSGHFGNQEQLWSHVLSVHPASFRLSNASQQRNPSGSEDFLQKQGRSVSAENFNSEDHSGGRKFICKFCGLKFDLLPDLGRHHQAAHMGPTSVSSRVSSRLSKRGIRFYACKLKSGRLTRPKFKKSLASVASYRIRNRSAQNVKKRLQSSNLVGTRGLGVRSSVVEKPNLDKLVDDQCLTVAKLLFTETKKTKPRPNNSDILSVAQSVCCKVSLKASLEAKYGSLPERIYLKAAKLCSEHNILVSWHLDGFVCPKGCGLFIGPQTPPLVPLPNFKNRPKFSRPNPIVSEWKLDESHYVIDSHQIRHETSDGTIILCDDISNGKESVPITCVVEENLLGSLHILPDESDGQIAANSLPWESFSYITKPVLDQSLQCDLNSPQLGCSCPTSMCSSQTCDHVYLFDTDYEDAKDIYGQRMHGRFPYDERGRIILEEGYLVYECNQRCCCGKSCQNRVLQNGVQVKLEIFKTETKGWAVRAREAILRGTFVCEFMGEVIDEQEAERRCSRYGKEGCAYFLEVDVHINDMSRLVEGQSPYVIDATKYGNVSRYINHSCSPNLVNHQVLVESMDHQLAHIGLYAGRDILAGEELTFDYRYKPLPGEGVKCLCGSSNCRGRLY